MRDVRERFLSHCTVGSDDDCWIWHGAQIGDGYGQFTWNRDGRRTWQSHLVSYLLFVGPLPEGTEIDHTCRVRLCVNPRHLEAVTHLVNVQRATQARLDGRCKNGHEYAIVGVYIRPSDNAHLCQECRRDSRRRHAVSRGAPSVDIYVEQELPCCAFDRPQDSRCVLHCLRLCPARFERQRHADIGGLPS